MAELLLNRDLLAAATDKLSESQRQTVVTYWLAMALTVPGTLAGQRDHPALLSNRWSRVGLKICKIDSLSSRWQQTC
jgi:hypothetical protein